MALPKPSKAGCMTKDEVRKRLEEYYTSLGSMQTERWVAEFARNAVVEDPPGADKIVGREALAAFFENVKKGFTQLNLTTDYIVIIPPEAVVKWTTEGKTTTGLKAVFQGISTFVFDDNGKIAHMRAFWDEEETTKQFELAAVPSREK